MASLIAYLLHYFWAPSGIGCKLLNWIKTRVSLCTPALIEQVYLGASEEILEILLTLRLAHFKVVPAPISLKFLRLSSDRARPQNGTTAAVHNGCSRVRCAAADSEGRNCLGGKIMTAFWVRCKGAHCKRCFSVLYINCSEVKRGITHFRLMSFFDGEIR